MTDVFKDFGKSKAISYCCSWFCICALQSAINWHKGIHKKHFYELFNGGLVDPKLTNVDQVKSVKEGKPIFGGTNDELVKVVDEGHPL